MALARPLLCQRDVNHRQSTLNDSKAGPPSLRPALDPEPVSWVALPPRVMPWNVSRIDTPVIATVEADRLGAVSRKVRSLAPTRTQNNPGTATLAVAVQGSWK